MLRLFLGLTVAAFAALAPIQRPAPPRVVAVGDVHGAAGAFAAVLQRAGLIDADQKWSGGNAILVQTGDLTDRGTDVRAALDLLMKIEPQAAAAGGRVHALMGNHEAMNLLGEMRDATPEIFATFADAESERRRERAFTDAQKINKKLDKAGWMASHPPGLLEYSEALRPNGRYGKWLRAKPVLVEIGGTVYMHAGLSPETTGSLDDVVKRVRQDLAAWDDGVKWLEQKKLVPALASLGEIVTAADGVLRPLAPRINKGEASEDDVQTARVLLPILQIDKSSLLDSNGPLWFRGFANWSDDEGAPLMAAVLKKFGVRRFVTGHTPLAPQKYRIQRRFGGSLFLIDTGMLDGKYFPGGRGSALELLGDQATAIYEDGRVPF